MDVARFRVPERTPVDLKKWPTKVKPFYDSKEQYQRLLADHVDKLDKRQNLLYAHDRYALLLIFQAMDAAGKDGVIKHVMSGLNPQGCQVFSFKHPSATELDHDFLWRTTTCLPERGRIGIFNRSYYEEVLIVRVHPEILQAQRLPDDVLHDSNLWKSRYRSIVDLERHLHRNGTRIVKFFLHVSKEEQKRRFLERLDEPEKNWKFQSGDVAERAHWVEYHDAYEQAIRNTASKHAPWYVVPADNKWYTRMIVAAAVVDALGELDLSYPKVGKEKLKELAESRAALSKQSGKRK